MTKGMQRTNKPCKVLYTGSASKSFTATKCSSESNKVRLGMEALVVGQLCPGQ